MKKIKLSFKSVTSLKNLHFAFLSAAKNKQKRAKILNFKLNLFELNTLFKALKKQNYKPSGYFEFFVKERKLRLIKAPFFKDSIAAHAIYNKAYEAYKKRFLNVNFGCVKGCGIFHAKKRLKSFVKSSDENKFYLQCDIKKYFASVNNEVLKALLKKHFKDEKLIDLMLSFNAEKKGLAMGNLLSQFLSLIYLNELDEFVKKELKVKKYLRFVDDFIMLDLSLSEALSLLEKIKVFLKERLDLELSKYIIKPLSFGVSFAGFRVFKNYVLLRKYHIKAYKKALKRRNLNALKNYLAMAKNTRTLRFFKKELRKNGLRVVI